MYTYESILPFKEALLRARSPKLNSQKEWEMSCKAGAPQPQTKSTSMMMARLYGQWLIRDVYN